MIFKHNKCLSRVKFYQKLEYMLNNKLVIEKIYFCPKCNQLINQDEVIENRF